MYTIIFSQYTDPPLENWTTVCPAHNPKKYIEREREFQLRRHKTEGTLEGNNDKKEGLRK